MVYPICEGRVSDKAEFCPRCGLPIEIIIKKMVYRANVEPIAGIAVQNSPHIIMKYVWGADGLFVLYAIRAIPNAIMAEDIDLTKMGLIKKDLIGKVLIAMDSTKKKFIEMALYIMNLVLTMMGTIKMVSIKTVTIKTVMT